ncbi:MAG: phospholipase D-like domain-containing protein [Bacteroidota bacterium]|nr:phospholipase D-like domain-containing protein [Bacteroidota bacterium]
MFVTASNNGFSLKAWQGSTMTMLAMNMAEKPADGTFAGFTLAYINQRGKKYFIQNLLNFEGINNVTSSNASPIQLFRWVHFPGSYQQTGILTGEYIYMATPRFLDINKKLLPTDKTQTVSVKIMVDDFTKAGFSMGFTRAFLKSQAFANRYGASQKLIPGGDWLFDTNTIAGNFHNQDFTYENMYVWLGFSARKKTYNLLKEALDNEDVSVDMYAYDYNDPVIAKMCLDLGTRGSIRMIIDNASLHTGDKAEEDDFTKRFQLAATGNSEIFRCHFARYSHCKIIILKKKNKPYKVLTGSTNFSYTGLYINANHVLVFDNKNVAEYYGNVFNACWKKGNAPLFRATNYALHPKKFQKPAVPTTEINFSPHSPEYAAQVIDAITKNVLDKSTKSVLFSVMELGVTSTGSLIPALRELHKNDAIYTYGVTDSSGDEISLYKPGKKTGLLINAKAANRELPPPFNTEHSLGLAHAIHHKFVVINFNKSDAKVYCGSSNLALGGEKDNGDNLLCIKDTDVATAFAIEAIRLTDHYNFRSLKDKEEKAAEAGDVKKPITLDNTGKWVDKFYDENDIRYVERILFA